MSRTGAHNGHERRYLAPRRYVPFDLKAARVGCTDQGALTLATVLHKRMRDMRLRYRWHVLVDIDGAVYAVARSGESLSYVVANHPELLVGVYDKTACVGQIVDDLEEHRRGM